MAEPVGRVKGRVENDNYASFESERALLEMFKDEDSPACPNSWTWILWFDGLSFDQTVDEMSFADGVDDAIESVDGIIRELAGLHEYLVSFREMAREGL